MQQIKLQFSKQLGETEEENRVYEDDEMIIYAVTPGHLFWQHSLYIKVFTKKYNTNEFKNISRISMLKPEYVNCEYKNTILSNKQIDHLILALNLLLEDDDITTWKLIIKTNNFLRRIITNQFCDPIPYDLPIPNYELLKR